MEIFGTPDDPNTNKKGGLEGCKGAGNAKYGKASKPCRLFCALPDSPEQSWEWVRVVR